MEPRQLGSSDLEITPIVLGTWALGGWLWGGTSHNDADGAIGAALDAGINCIDTAPMYGFGLSEELVGDAIRERRDDVVLASKCGLVWDGRSGGSPFFDTTDPDGNVVSVDRCLRKESILAECEDSLRRLRVDVIDLYQCHWPDPGTPLEDTIDGLLTLQEQGKIRAFGMSNFTVDLLQECVDLDAVPASNQPKYSLLSREIEANVLPFCREHDIGSLAYSPMEMGLLTGKIGMDHVFEGDDTRPNRPWFLPAKRQQVLKALDEIRPIAEKHGITLAQLAIAWVHNQPGMTAAVVGARNREQAESNAKAGTIELPPEDLSAIRTVFEPLVLDEPYDPAKVKR